MDPVQVGKLIARLRRERGLTQEALGAKLGVSNKTISRWEHGSYMPDIEMLQLLGKEFYISVDELLAGERAEEGQTPAAARPRREGKKSERFSTAEKAVFWKRKWIREHWAVFPVLILPILLILIAGWLKGWAAFVGLAVILALAAYGIIRNRMMAYVEARAFGSLGDGEEAG